VSDRTGKVGIGEGKKPRIGGSWEVQKEESKGQALGREEEKGGGRFVKGSTTMYENIKVKEARRKGEVGLNIGDHMR